MYDDFNEQIFEAITDDITQDPEFKDNAYLLVVDDLGTAFERPSKTAPQENVAAPALQALYDSSRVTPFACSIPKSGKTPPTSLLFIQTTNTNGKPSMK
jgi:hypothetical protein